MSSYKINLKELFKSQFRLNADLSTKNVFDKKSAAFKGIKVLENQKQLSKTSLEGIPVWDYIRLLPKKIVGTGDNFEGYDFPLECVVEGNLPKKIVETEIFGMDGTVEELMGINDWIISIKGFIINYKSKDYPEDQVKALKNACSLKDCELGVEGTFLNMLGINYISIHSLNLPASVGYGNMQSFEIEARSKIPFIINNQDGILL